MKFYIFVHIERDLRKFTDDSGDFYYSLWVLLWRMWRMLPKICILWNSYGLCTPVSLKSVPISTLNSFLYKIQTKYYKKNLNWLFKVRQINQILTSSKLSNLSQARAKAQGCQDEHSKQSPTALSTLLNNLTLWLIEL